MLAEQGPNIPWADVAEELERKIGITDSELADVQVSLDGCDWARLRDVQSFGQPVDNLIVDEVDTDAVEFVRGLLSEEDWNRGPRAVSTAVAGEAWMRPVSNDLLLVTLLLLMTHETDGENRGSDSRYLWGSRRLAYMAWLSYVLEFSELHIPDEVLRRCNAFLSQRYSGPAMAFAGFICVSERPTLIERDQAGALHCESGPALQWSDGLSKYYWHGREVPYDFYNWSLEDAISQHNTEQRRMGIERHGWNSVIDRLTLVAEAPDPANEPHMIRLYDLPSQLQVHQEPARVLVVENASLDKGGARRTFALLVPAEFTDPLEAAAELFGISIDEYRNTQRAT